MINFYPLAKQILFSIDAEKAHNCVLSTLPLLHKVGFLPLIAAKSNSLPVSVMGLSFPNPLGLAAGLDKNGHCIDALGALGFGFIEIGTVTPRPQVGNPKPRMFRLRDAEAIINRMGFNNLGVDHLVNQVTRSHYRGILGVNIGKNFDTPLENAVNDYLICFRKVYPYASYVTVNISSPNTVGLRNLQQKDELVKLLEPLQREKEILSKSHGKSVPLALKIAPDLTEEDIDVIAQTLLEFKIDAVIATNTTLARDKVAGEPFAEEKGGLSGRPLFSQSLSVVKKLARSLDGKLPIIGVGGIFSGANAAEFLNAGASLIQIYSGFVYRGPILLQEILNTLKENQ